LKEIKMGSTGKKKRFRRRINASGNHDDPQYMGEEAQNQRRSENRKGAGGKITAYVA